MTTSSLPEHNGAACMGNEYYLPFPHALTVALLHRSKRLHLLVRPFVEQSQSRVLGVSKRFPLSAEQ
jgi:hypothetical protein